MLKLCVLLSNILLGLLRMCLLILACKPRKRLIELDSAEDGVDDQGTEEQYG